MYNNTDMLEVLDQTQPHAWSQAIEAENSGSGRELGAGLGIDPSHHDSQCPKEARRVGIPMKSLKMIVKLAVVTGIFAGAISSVQTAGAFPSIVGRPR